MPTMIHVKNRQVIDNQLVYHCILHDGSKVEAEKDVPAAKLVQQLKDTPTEHINVMLNSAGEIVYMDGSPVPIQGDTSGSHLPQKERLIVQQLRGFIDGDNDYTVALVAGIRRIGKTTALRQLELSYDGAVYIDCTVSSTEAIQAAMSNPDTKLLLLDEITLLDDFECTAQHIYDMTIRHDRTIKVIMSGSSAAHIVRLRESKLGGGRARLFRLPPIMFIEYLYMTGKIPSYNDYAAVNNDYFADYLLLKDFESNLRVHFDGTYFSNFYTDTQNANEASSLTSSLIELGDGDLQAMADLVAYKLSEDRSYAKTVAPKVGTREFRSLEKQGIELDKSSVDLSDVFVNSSIDHLAGVTASDKGRIMAFLLWSGIASVEFTKVDDITQFQAVHNILGALKNAKSDNDLKDIFRQVSICFTSPLFYTRLGRDIFKRMRVQGIEEEDLATGSLLGMMLETYVRGGFTGRDEIGAIQSSVKLNYVDIGEVDIYCKYGRLLCEITKGHKAPDSVRLNKYFKNTPHIRILTTENEYTEPLDGTGYYKIPYAKFCCMLDTGDIFKLAATVAE